MNFKHILTGIVLLISMMLSGCAYYEGGHEYGYPYREYRGGYYGEPYHHESYGHDHDDRHGQGDYEHYQHHDEDRN